MTGPVIRPVTEWPADYDATLSMQNAMCEAGDALRKCNGSFPVERYMAMVADAEIWVRIAQVHATNALTAATRERVPAPLPKKNCRCL